MRVYGVRWRCIFPVCKLKYENNLLRCQWFSISFWDFYSWAERRLRLWLQLAQKFWRVLVSLPYTSKLSSETFKEHLSNCRAIDHFHCCWTASVEQPSYTSPPTWLLTYPAVVVRPAAEHAPVLLMNAAPRACCCLRAWLNIDENKTGTVVETEENTNRKKTTQKNRRRYWRSEEKKTPWSLHVSPARNIGHIVYNLYCLYRVICASG